MGMNKNAQPPTSKLAVTSRPAQPLMKLSVITTLEESSTEEDLEDQRRRNLRMQRRRKKGMRLLRPRDRRGSLISQLTEAEPLETLGSMLILEEALDLEEDHLELVSMLTLEVVLDL